MNNQNHRGRNSMKLLGTLRGDGVLAWEGGQAAVGYQLDRYESRNQITGSGSLDGDLSALETGEIERGVLTIEDGTAIEVRISEPDDQGGMFDSIGPIPA